MKRLISIVAATLIFVTGCVSKAPPPTVQNTTSSALIPPWPNTEVFTDPDLPIAVSVGQEFVIRYDFYNSITSTFQVDHSPTDFVLLEEQRTTRPELSLDGTQWFLFKAEANGTTNVTISERGHLMPIGFVSQKIFLINVGPPKPTSLPVITPNTTGNPWPNLQVFTNLFTNQNPSVNVTVGQEFVIKFNQFTSSNIAFQPANVVIVESKQFVQNPATVIPDGTTWILFKAVAVGSTKVSVTETTRFGDPLQTKTFTVNVGPE